MTSQCWVEVSFKRKSCPDIHLAVDWDVKQQYKSGIVEVANLFPTCLSLIGLVTNRSASFQAISVIVS